MSRHSRRTTPRETRKPRSRAVRVLGAAALVLAPLVVVPIMGSGSAASQALAAVAMGLVFELLWLTGSTPQVAWMSLVALGISFFGFLPWKREGRYSYQAHLDAWPLYFTGSLLLVMLAFHRKQLIARIGEGSTLLHSMVFFYWMLDVSARHPGVSLVLVIVAAVPLLFSAIHAWSPLPLSSRSRLGLSLWSSAVILALAIQTVFYAVGRAQEPGARAFLECFLLGTAAGYMATNATLLGGYLPGRGMFFNRAYFQWVRELNQEHVTRFSAQQITPSQATAVTAGVGAFLAIHWFLRPFPTAVAIWLVLTVVPWAMHAWGWWMARRKVPASC